MKVYAIRDKKTKKLLSRKCKSGKFYKRKSDALKKCYSIDDSEEVVEFDLIQVNQKEFGKLYVFSYLENPSTDRIYISEKRLRNFDYYIFELKELNTYQ